MDNSQNLIVKNKTKLSNSKMGKRHKQIFYPRNFSSWQTKYMKRCLILLTMREIQIKITIRYQCTLIRIPKIKKQWQHQMHMRVQRNWIIYTLLVGMYNGVHTVFEIHLIVTFKTKHATTIWPRNHTLGHLSQRN